MAHGELRPLPCRRGALSPPAMYLSSPQRSLCLAAASVALLLNLAVPPAMAPSNPHFASPERGHGLIVDPVTAARAVSGPWSRGRPWPCLSGTWSHEPVCPSTAEQAACGLWSRDRSRSGPRRDRGRGRAASNGLAHKCCFIKWHVL